MASANSSATFSSCRFIADLSPSACSLLFFDRAEQPGARKSQVALDGALRHGHLVGGKDGGYLFDLEPAEEVQLDDLRLAWIFLLEYLESVAERHQIDVLHLGDALGAGQRERDLAAAALLRRLLARVIDQDVAHGAGRDADEMCTALPLDVPQVEQLQIGLMYQGGRL